VRRQLDAEVNAAAPDIIPDEIARLRLEPGDRLIVRCTQLTSTQVHEYREYLQAWFPDNDVLVLIGDEIAVEPAKPEPIAIPDPEITGVVTVGFAQVGDFASFASLEICDAHTGEAFTSVTEAHLDAHPKRGVTIRLTELLGETGHPIRQHNNREKTAPPVGENIPTITRTFLVAPHRLGGGDG
jgi:hypothetical protein